MSFVSVSLLSYCAHVCRVSQDIKDALLDTLKCAEIESDPDLVCHDDGYSKLVLAIMAGMCDGLNVSLQVSVTASTAVYM